MTEDSPDAGDVKSTRLRELQALADEGLITPDEYEQHRRRIRGETGDGEPVDAATAEAATTGSHARRSPRPARRVDQQGVVPGHVGRQRELLPRGAQKRNASASRGKPKGSRAISGTGSLPRTAAQPSPQATATRRGSRRDLWQLPRLRGTTSGGVDRDWPWRRWRSAACDSGGGARPVGSRNGVRGERSLASARDTHRAPIER